ncbi:hypothetical protein EGW08_007694 [Elysia chlorotica]|uniref:Uncharacterized protein n=1 Tax=Elysia chlorotica TaxID=188477 RepID=A0A433TSH5_ELYCH|nr:hypothetical protein EGW08_007694 [Elysia chlorotica]
MSLSEMLHGSSASSSFEDDNEENELDKGANSHRNAGENCLKPSDKQALARSSSFKANLKSFCRAIQGDSGDRAHAKSLTSDSARPSCLSSSKGNNRGPICGQSIVDGGTRADFFTVDALGAGFLGEACVEPARTGGRGPSPKSVSFSDGSLALSTKGNHGDGHNNNNNCNSGILPNNKVHPTNESVTCSDTGSLSPDVFAATGQRSPPPQPVQPASRAKGKNASGAEPQDFNDVFEVFHDTQSDVTCCSTFDLPMSSYIQSQMVERSSPLEPQSVLDRSSSSNPKEKSKCNEIDNYMREEKAAQARYLASVLPAAVLARATSEGSDASGESGDRTRGGQAARERLSGVSLDEQDLSRATAQDTPAVTLDSAHSCRAAPPLAARVLEKLTPCSSASGLASGLELAGCVGCAAISAPSLPAPPSPKIFLPSSSTSSTCSSSSSRAGSSPTRSNGSPPSLDLSAESSPRSSSSSAFSPLKMAGVSFFSYPACPAPLSSTPSAGPKPQAADKMTAPDTIPPNKSSTPRPASRVSPLCCSGPAEPSCKAPPASPLSNGVSNYCDQPAQLLRAPSKNKRITFVPDTNNHKAKVGPASDIPGMRMTPSHHGPGELRTNHQAVRSHKTNSNATGSRSAVKDSSKPDVDLYRQKETAL